MSLILNGTTGISDVDGTAAAPALTGTDTNTGIFFPAADTIGFSEGGVEAMRLNASGNLQTIGTISVGNATPSTSGAGITFPATQSASSDANTLDDYEEGTWTPNQGAGLTIVGTFSSSGTYTKVGRIVTLSARYNPSTSVTVAGGGNAMSTNAPFAGVRNETGVTTNDAQSTFGGLILSSSQILSTSVIASTANVYWSLTYITS